MNLDQKSSPQSASSGRSPAAESADQVAVLSLRLKRLIKGLQLFARRCNAAPSQVGAVVKQFVDLAEIELNEGLKTLQTDPAPPTSSNAAERGPQCIGKQGDIASSAEPSQQKSSWDESVAAPLVLTYPPRIPTSKPDSFDVRFDSVSQLAEVPEANDIEAILARLQACSEALDAAELEERTVDSPVGTEARELLLGFDICRLELPPLPGVRPDQTTESNQVQASGDSPPVTTVASAFEATATTLQHPLDVVEVKPAQYSEPSFTGQLPSTVIETPSSSDSRNSDVITDYTAIHHVELPSDYSRDPEQVATWEIIAAAKNGSRKEYGENSNPLNSIHPDNLAELNVLKVELLGLLPQYKALVSASMNS